MDKLHDISQLLAVVTKQLNTYIQNVLPSLSNAWWEELVLPSLSFQQLRFVEQRREPSLSRLDLAALLRVFDQNWYAIAEAEKLTNEVRNYLKEMQTVRNRWAHATTVEFPDEDVYRDLDTIQRFVTAIRADAGSIAQVRCEKENLLPHEAERAAVTAAPSTTATTSV